MNSRELRDIQLSREIRGIHRNLSYEQSIFNKNKNGSFFYYTTKALNTYCEAVYPDNSYLLFGREDQGLPEDLLHKNKESCVRIPMLDNEAARSLNLSNSVAIAAYEVLRQWNFPKLKNKGKLTQYDWN